MFSMRFNHGSQWRDRKWAIATRRRRNPPVEEVIKTKVGYHQPINDIDRPYLWSINDHINQEVSNNE